MCPDNLNNPWLPTLLLTAVCIHSCNSCYEVMIIIIINSKYVTLKIFLAANS